MKWFLRTSYILFAFFLVYNIWSRTGRNFHYTCQYRTQTHSYGQNNGHGNLLGIQPWFSPFDFSRPSAFYSILDHHFKKAQQAGFLHSNTIVVLPEYIGTWLVVAGEKNAVFTHKELEPAMKKMVLSNLGGYLLHYIQARSDDKPKEALFRMKARYMKNIYEKTFSTLAKKYKVSIVAGSLLLPGPNIADGELRTDKKGNLYNVSCVFGPDGRVQAPLVIKQFPIEEEKPFTDCIKDTTPVFHTPAGQLAVLICADSWYPEAYKNIRDMDLIVSPSYVSPGGSWQKPWAGYSGASAPADVDPADAGRIPEKDAWLKYSMAHRGPQAGIRNGMQVFLRGDFWDIGSDGSAIAYSDSTIIQVPEPARHHGQIINLWLP